MLSLNRLIHLSIRELQRKSHQAFRDCHGGLQATQEHILRGLVQRSTQTQWGQRHGMARVKNYQDYRQLVSVGQWEEWEYDTLEQKRTGQFLVAAEKPRWQPTSGSTHARKWIPYTTRFLQEIDRAAAVWMADLYLRYPKISQGRHYWSLSWLPQDLRGQLDNSDLSYFPAVKRWLMSQMMATPDSIQLAQTSESCRFATLAYLLARVDLTLISVWSPTFLLTQLRDLAQWREDLSKTLSEGQWSLFATELQQVSCPRNKIAARNIASSHDVSILLQQLWPKLALISCWDSAESAHWSRVVQSYFPNVSLQGKGLFATEGAVTIPLKEGHALTYTSHFYEFIRNQEIIPSWELKDGDIVSPVLTTGSGFMRYHLPDSLQVTGHLGEIPLLTFLGRESTVDMVGEKLHHSDATNFLGEVAKLYPQTKPLALLAIAQCKVSGTPRYTLAIESDGQPDLLLDCQRIEALLERHYHYRLARELGQLAALQVSIIRNSVDFYQRVSLLRGQIEGDLKPDPLIRLPHWDYGENS